MSYQDKLNIARTKQTELELNFERAEAPGHYSEEATRTIEEGRDAVLTGLNGKPIWQALQVVTEAFAAILHEAEVPPEEGGRVLVNVYRAAFPESDEIDALAGMLGMDDLGDDEPVSDEV